MPHDVLLFLLFVVYFAYNECYLLLMDIEHWSRSMTTINTLKFFIIYQNRYFYIGINQILISSMFCYRLNILTIFNLWFHQHIHIFENKFEKYFKNVTCNNLVRIRENLDNTNVFFLSVLIMAYLRKRGPRGTSFCTEICRRHCLGITVPKRGTGLSPWPLLVIHILYKKY